MKTRLADGPLAGQDIQEPAANTRELWACGPVRSGQAIPGPFYCYRYRHGAWHWVAAEGTRSAEEPVPAGDYTVANPREDHRPPQV